MAGGLMRWRGHGMVAILGCTVATLVANAANSSAVIGPRALGPPASGPDLSTMAFAVSDFPAGATVLHQGYVKPESGFVAEYDREFGTVRVGGKRLVGALDGVMLAKTPDAAETQFGFFSLGLVLEANRIGPSFAKHFGFKPKYTKVSGLYGLANGADSIATTIRIGTRAGEVRLVIALVRVGPVDSLIFFLGAPKARVGAIQAKLLARFAVQRVRAGLIPVDTSPPTASGLPQVGQTLSAAVGTWSNAPAGFAYQWERCDATGAGCTAIDGATGESYVITPTDLGSTLVVVITATNTYGTATATTVATPVISQ